MNVTEKRIDAGAVTLNVATVGSGPPVLLLHGFPDSWRLWEPQLHALADAGFRALAPDLRGYGRSDRPADVAAYRMPALVGDVVGLLDALGIDRAAVVGHDWGAALAWAVAIAHPDRVDRLAVLSVGHPGANTLAGIRQRQLAWYMLWFLTPGVAETVLPQDDWAALRAWAFGGSADPGPYHRRQLQAMAEPGALQAALAWYRANIRPDRFYTPAADPAAFPRVGCPTVGIWSEGDLFLTEEQMTGSARWVDGPWTYLRLPGDHWIPQSAPAEVARALLDFLR